MAQLLSPNFSFLKLMSTGLKYLFSKEHTWAAQSEDGSWLVGVSDYAQNMLGDVVFIDPPKVGQAVTQFEVCGLIESVKTGSDIYAPLTGVVQAINEDALSSPEKVNDHPYTTWLFKLEPSAGGVEVLLDQATYEAQV
ncbi:MULTISPECIES: glycine cleavage system protein H [unclassified Methylophilus]|uniref:glycine cleavage system protein H n=1 Tax=unclassified Methylophilus TaxID=2630143 RepID=UPI000AFD7D9E|nr:MULTISPECIES: glycine cleavage system protein GcvH [unclassified Methylophilus]